MQEGRAGLPDSAVKSERYERGESSMMKKQKIMLYRIIAAAVIYVPLFVLEHMGKLEFKSEIPVQFLLFMIPYLIVGWDIIYRAVRNISHGQVFDENFLMCIATFGALGVKEYSEAVAGMLFYQIGEVFQSYAVNRSRQSISAMMDICPEYANIEEDGKLKQVDPDDVEIGTEIVIKAGERVPLDGVVVSGTSFVDTSALTGESVPREVTEGSEIISGCVNGSGLLKVCTTKEFDDSTVAKILELVENASSKKAHVENFITKFAKYYTPAVVVMAVIIAFVPPLIMHTGFTAWFQRALTFLVISCPCALVISVPLSFFAGIGGASREGILIKGSSYIETLSKPSVVVFDKTGTLTKGVFKVTEIVSQNPDLLRYAALAESASSHPIAAAIKKEYGKKIPPQNNIREIAGCGVEAVIDGKKILAGNARFAGTKPVNKDGTVVYVSIDGEFAGYIVISDEIKEDAPFAVSALKKMGITTEMLSGDTYKTAVSVQQTLSLDKVYAELLPEDKVNKLEELITNSSGSVIFAGDGINDAPVLTRADIGIAMGGLGSDAAIEAADVVIMDDKPFKVVTAIKISKRTMNIVKENIAFALGVKVLFLILGGFGFITMWGAVFADVGVALIAILNALRAIKRIK